MNQTELVDMIKAKPKAELLPLLHQWETALNAVTPAARRYAELSVRSDEIQQELQKGNENGEGGKKLLKIVVIATLVIAVLNYTVFSESFFQLLTSFAMGVGVLAIIVTACLTYSYQKTWKTAVEERDQVAAQLQEASREVERLKEQYADDLYLRQVACPRECVNPQYMRLFVSYFENGRADTMKEAWNLFDEYIHRERLEQMAADQVTAARAAQYAAERAATTASEAKSAADSAALYARYK